MSPTREVGHTLRSEASGPVRRPQDERGSCSDRPAPAHTLHVAPARLGRCHEMRRRRLLGALSPRPLRPPPGTMGRTAARSPHADVGWSVQRGERPAGGRLHSLDRARSGPRRRRPHGIGGPRPRSRPGGHPRRRGGRDDRRRARGPPRRGRGRDARLGRHARGRPPQPRGGTRRADRSGRRQGPHGTLPQRPGRDRPAAVAAADDRPPRRGRPRPRGGTRRSRRARRHGGPAGDDPHPAGPARPPRSSPPRLRRDARARPRPARRHAAAGEPEPARLGRPGRGGLPARPGGDGPGARLRRRRRPTRSTR